MERLQKFDTIIIEKDENEINSDPSNLLFRRQILPKADKIIPYLYEVNALSKTLKIFLFSFSYSQLWFPIFPYVNTRSNHIYAIWIVRIEAFWALWSYEYFIRGFIPKLDKLCW